MSKVRVGDFRHSIPALDVAVVHSVAGTRCSLSFGFRCYDGCKTYGCPSASVARGVESLSIDLLDGRPVKKSMAALQRL